MTWTLQRRSKFGAKKTVTGGRKYDSKLEAGHAQDLQWLLKAKQVLEVRPQVTLQLFAYGRKVCRYRMDFVIKTGPKCYRFDEVKGFETDTWRLKWALLEANIDHPDFRKYNGFKPGDEITMNLVK